MGVKPPTLEEHLEIEAIKQLRVLYSQLFDSHRSDELAMIFTEDAVCEFSDDLPYGDWVGRDEIREQYKKVAGGSAKPFSFMHATTNGWVELTGPDSATGSWFLLDLGLGDNPNPWVSWASTTTSTRRSTASGSSTARGSTTSGPRGQRAEASTEHQHLCCHGWRPRLLHLRRQRLGARCAGRGTARLVD